MEIQLKVFVFGLDLCCEQNTRCSKIAKTPDCDMIGLGVQLNLGSRSVCKEKQQKNIWSRRRNPFPGNKNWLQINMIELSLCSQTHQISRQAREDHPNKVAFAGLGSTCERQGQGRPGDVRT